MFYEVIDQDIKSGPKILRSHTFYSSYDGKPMFNGVQHLEPNSFLFTGKDIKVGLELPLTPVDNDDSEDPNWFAVDDDSNDYEDDDMFLVLSKEEAVDLIKTMIKFTVHRSASEHKTATKSRKNMRMTVNESAHK